MTKKITTAFAISCLLALPACDDTTSTKQVAADEPATKAEPKSKPETAKAPVEAATEQPATDKLAAAPKVEAPAKPAGPVVLAPLPLKIDGAGVTEADGRGSTMVIARGEGVNVMISKASTPMYKTAKGAKNMASISKPKDWATESVDDGYVATFTIVERGKALGGDGKAGEPIYKLIGYRTIGGVGYECQATTSTAAEQASAKAVCLGLLAT